METLQELKTRLSRQIIEAEKVLEMIDDRVCRSDSIDFLNTALKTVVSNLRVTARNYQRALIED